MSDVLSKPLQLADLSGKLSQWLPDPPLDASDAGPAAGIPSDQATQAELQRLFARVGKADLEKLLAAIERQDLASATDTLHRLLGALPLFAQDDLLEEGHQLLDALQTSPQPQHLTQAKSFADGIGRLLLQLG